MVKQITPELKKQTLKAKKNLEEKIKPKKAIDVVKNYDKEIQKMDKSTIKLVNAYRKLLAKCIIEKNIESVKSKFNLSGKNADAIYDNIIIKNSEEKSKQKKLYQEKQNLKQNIKEAKERFENKEKNVQYEKEMILILKGIKKPENKIKELDIFLKKKGLDDYLKNYVKTAKDKLQGKKITNEKSIKPKVIEKPLPPVLSKEEEIVKKIPKLKQEVSKDQEKIKQLQKELSELKAKKLLKTPPGLKNTELYDDKGNLKPPPGLTQPLMQKMEKLENNIQSLNKKISYGTDDKDINTKGMKKIIPPQMEPPVTESVLDQRYVKNVRIKYGGSVKNLKDYPKIYEKLINPQLINFKGADKIIEKAVGSKDKNKKKPSWVKCDKNCYKELTNLLDKETTLTAFMLRILSESVIDTTKGNMPLVFTCKDQSGKKLNGKWKNDSKYFNMEELDNSTKQRRLIMGFGPSASGKTFWATNIIKILGMSDESFPKAFLSVDGGNVREFSYMYQHIIDEIKKHPNILGFDNLVNAGFSPGTRSLFLSNNVKKAIKKYLKDQSERQKDFKGSPVSLYIPETLGSCALANPIKPCDAKYKTYINMTGDKKWIGLYIYQHLYRKDCTFGNGFKCFSCSESGTSRELDEGKKYSSTAYSTSKKYGIMQMKHAMGGRFEIHNCGDREWCKKNKSTFTEWPIKGKYILGTSKSKIEKDYNCKYIGAESSDKQIKNNLKIARQEAKTEEEKKAIDKITQAFKDKEKKGKPIPNWNPRENKEIQKPKIKTVNSTVFDGGNKCESVKVTAKTCGDHVYKHTDKKIYVCRNPATTPTKEKPGKCRPAAGVFGNTRVLAKDDHPILVERGRREKVMKKQPGPQGVGKRVISNEKKSKSDSLRKSVLKNNANKTKKKKDEKKKGNNKTRKNK